LRVGDVTLKRAVKIVDNPKILTDPIRREILRLLVIQPHTATQLAEKLNLTKSTVGHHIHTLQRAKLIRIKWAKPGSHGIVEKYYEPIALVFIENYNKMPVEMRKYFLSIHMERLRGMFSTLQLIGDATSAFRLVRESWEHMVEAPRGLNSDLLSELANETLRCMTQIGEGYEREMTDLDGETLLTKIYSETLRLILTRGIWRKVFANVSGINVLITEGNSQER